MNRSWIILAAALGSLGSPAPTLAGATCSPADHGEHTSTDIKEISWMRLGKGLIRNKLKDGESARFKDVYFCRGIHKVPVTCGLVSAKNSFGAYTGYQRFVSPGKAELSFVESQVEGFGGVWSGCCR